MVAVPFLGLIAPQNPLLRTLVPCTAVAFVFQAAIGLPSTFLVRRPTERFYDITGAFSHVVVAVLGLSLPRRHAAEGLHAVTAGSTAHLPGPTWRQLAATSAVLIWALRLGSFLFARILREGPDNRFDALRSAPLRMIVPWMAQAMWVVVCQLPVMLTNAEPPVMADASRVLWTDVLGFGLYAVGLVFETVADTQKTRWMAAWHAKKHNSVVMTEGLWGRSRHPNYFGETVLWAGLATVAAGAAGTSLLSLVVCVASPAFVAFLLLRVSGVPLVEPKHDRQYGHRADYRAWKARTPQFIPRLW